MNPRTPFLLLAATAAAALALTGCSGSAAGDDGAGGSGGKLRVVATTTQLGDFAAEVGGDDIELTTLLAPGSSAHHFDPSPDQLLALGRADVLLENGAGLEGFVDSAIEASGFSGATVVAADGVDPEEAEAITREGGGYVDEHDHEHDHGDEPGDEHADEEGHDHEAEDHDDADEHEHGDLNPHLWTSPGFAEGMVTEVAEGLAAADSAHASDYRDRADAYTAKLRALDSWIADQFAEVPESERLFVSGHDAMRYYLHDYGIEYIGSLLPGFEDNAEPSAAQIDELIAEIEEHRVKAIFTESSISPKLAETVAKQTGASWVSGEDALYVDALGPADSDAATYIGATVHNTRTILEAWGYAVAPLPAELEDS